MNATAQLDTPRRLWLRVEDFLLLDHSGAFGDFAKTELIDGEILCMNAQFQRHSYAKSQLAFRVTNVLPSGLMALVEVAIAMPPHDMPEPDIVIMRGPLGDGPLTLDQVALVIEVADTTRETDLGRKAGLYARGAIAEYWVVDLQNAQIVRHWQPGVDGYGVRDTTPLGTNLTAATLPSLTIATNGLV
jgi:Uma2 family endonuclease